MNRFGAWYAASASGHAPRECPAYQHVLVSTPHCPLVRTVDLHAHTTVSDGTLSPTALVELAAKEGLAALAITDHDHVGGLAEARKAGARVGVEIVPGIELSVAHRSGDIHLLGYLIDDEHPALLAKLGELRAARATRASRIVDRLRELGVEVELADVERHAAGGAVGRPHVARALVDRGHVASIAEAFDKYLADGRPAAVPKAKLSAADAIALVHAAGGVSVAAHPVTVRVGRQAMLREMAALGLDGIEVEHPQQDEAVRVGLRALAAELKLATTGGSDHHGENKPDVRLGMTRVPYETLDALRRRGEARRGARTPSAPGRP